MPRVFGHAGFFYAIGDAVAVATGMGWHTRPAPWFRCSCSPIASRKRSGPGTRINYADGIMGSAAVGQEMKRAGHLAGASGGYVYGAAVSVAHPPADYTARVMPHYDGAAIPLENTRILWQR